MKCIAVDCNKKPVDGEQCCDQHLALIVKFKRAFDNPRLASQVLNFVHPARFPVIDIEVKNPSTEIAIYKTNGE